MWPCVELLSILQSFGASHLSWSHASICAPGKNYHAAMAPSISQRWQEQAAISSIHQVLLPYPKSTPWQDKWTYLAYCALKCTYFSQFYNFKNITINCMLLYLLKLPVHLFQWLFQPTHDKKSWISNWSFRPDVHLNYSRETTFLTEK